jgi:hypothetical protein
MVSVNWIDIKHLLNLIIYLKVNIILQQLNTLYKIETHHMKINLFLHIVIHLKEIQNLLIVVLIAQDIVIVYMEIIVFK